MTILLTGGTGLIGGAVLDLLSGSGVTEVVALHRPGSCPPAIPGVSWVAQDLGAPLGRKLPSRVETVLHLAQSRRHRDFPAGATDTFEINAMATVRLLDYCRRAQGANFVLASSGAVYRPGERALRESDPPDPPSFYGHTKLAAERAAEEFSEFFRVKRVRFFFVYGPRQDGGAFMPALARRVREGTPVELAGMDGMRCNPVYVDDAAAAVIAAARGVSGGAVNVAGPEVVDLRQISEQIAGQVGGAARYVKRPQGGDLIADTTLMRSELLAPTVTPADGIARTFGPPGGA